MLIWISFFPPQPRTYQFTAWFDEDEKASHETSTSTANVEMYSAERQESMRKQVNNFFYQAEFLLILLNLIWILLFIELHTLLHVYNFWDWQRRTYLETWPNWWFCKFLFDKKYV